MAFSTLCPRERCIRVLDDTYIRIHQVLQNMLIGMVMRVVVKGLGFCDSEPRVGCVSSATESTNSFRPSCNVR